MREVFVPNTRKKCDAHRLSVLETHLCPQHDGNSCPSSRYLSSSSAAIRPRRGKEKGSSDRGSNDLKWWSQNYVNIGWFANHRDRKIENCDHHHTVRSLSNPVIGWNGARIAFPPRQKLVRAPLAIGIPTTRRKLVF